MRFCASALALAACAVGAARASSSADVPALRERVTTLLGDDTRLIRHDPTEHTKAKQAELCGDLTAVLADLVAKAEAHRTDAEWLYLAGDYAALCLSGNPANREAFSRVEGVHRAVGRLIANFRTEEASPREPDGYFSHRLPAKMAQVVYAAVFGNAVNHRRFFEDVRVEPAGHEPDPEDPKNLPLGVIDPLLAIVEDYAITLQTHLDHKEGVLFSMDENAEETDPPATSILPLSAMWAAAALQNMAANYCDTESSKCDYEFDKETGELKVQQTVLSDGSAMRVAMINAESHFLLWDMGMHSLVCHAPSSELIATLHGLGVQYGDEDFELGSKSKSVRAHDPAHADHDVAHELLETLVPWAAAGLVKNLAIEASASPELRATLLDGLLPCLCELAGKSADDYERELAAAAIARMRPADPCWFPDTPGGTNYQRRREEEEEYIPGQDDPVRHQEEAEHDEFDESQVPPADADLEVAPHQDLDPLDDSILCVDMYFFHQGKTCADYRFGDEADCDDMALVHCCACGGGKHEDDIDFFDGDYEDVEDDEDEDLEADEYDPDDYQVEEEL